MSYEITWLDLTLTWFVSQFVLDLSFKNFPFVGCLFYKAQEYGGDWNGQWHLPLVFENGLCQGQFMEIQRRDYINLTRFGN